ncbi:MAG TPA: response regulator transcription factor [Verrucomicrobiae bacterium]|jgi:DNA-binding NarL/FixJ family response regulator
MTKIAIVEDNPDIRQSLTEWINAAPGYECVCACPNSKTALAQIPRLKPDVVLMDIRLPDESGIVCTSLLKSLLPDLQVIVLTVYRDRDLLFQALNAGASGYLLKRSKPADVLNAIAEVLSGGAPMTGEIARMVIETFHGPATKRQGEPGLSERENEILLLVSKGLGNKEIGIKLNISYYTVRAHLRKIYEKLHVHGRSEAVARAIQGNR